MWEVAKKSSLSSLIVLFRQNWDKRCLNYQRRQGKSVHQSQILFCSKQNETVNSVKRDNYCCDSGLLLQNKRTIFDEERAEKREHVKGNVYYIF